MISNIRIFDLAIDSLIYHSGWVGHGSFNESDIKVNHSITVNHKKYIVNRIEVSIAKSINVACTDIFVIPLNSN